MGTGYRGDEYERRRLKLLWLALGCWALVWVIVLLWP